VCARRAVRPKHEPWLTWLNLGAPRSSRLTSLAELNQSML
jgi:hypothetical protein